VRNLAERVVASSGEIKGLVAQSEGEVRQGSVLVANAGTKLGQILDLIRGNAADMGEIAAACGQQATAVAEVSTAVAQLEDNTSQNAALVDLTNAQLRDVEAELGRLEAVVAPFAGVPPAPPLPEVPLSRSPVVPPAARPSLSPAPARRVLDRVQARPAPPIAGNVALQPDQDWDEF
jgi:methyl-accepting chemotaxis protein